MKDTFVHTLFDLPAYAVIAWVKVADAVPSDIGTIERLLLDWGWLLLLGVRLLNALIDLYKRSREHEFLINENGEQKKVGVLKSLLWELKNILK